MSSVFLPLRSNSAWFTEAETHARLTRRLKHLVLFSDEIIVQDGRFEATFLANGSSDHVIPGDMVRDRTKIVYHQPGSRFEMRIAPSGTQDFSPVLAGPVEASFNVDFMPALSEAGIAQADFIKWVDVGLTSDGRQQAQRAAFIARRDPSVFEGLPENRILRQKIVDAVHEDAVLAGGLGVPLSIDHHAASVVERVNRAALSSLDPRLKPAFQESWVSIGLPNPGDETWESVVRARESSPGADLRRVVSKLEGLAVAALAGGATNEDIENETRKLLVAEIVDELFQRRVSVGGTALSLGLNWVDLVPGANAAIGSVQDIFALAKEKRSWVSFLKGFGHHPQIVVKE